MKKREAEIFLGESLNSDEYQFFLKAYNKGLSDRKVIISNLKQSWNREEVLELLDKRIESMKRFNDESLSSKEWLSDFELNILHDSK